MMHKGEEREMLTTDPLQKSKITHRSIKTKFAGLTAVKENMTVTTSGRCLRRRMSQGAVMGLGLEMGLAKLELLGIGLI